MCGISGVIYFNGKAVLEDELRQMASFIKERGPDADGLYRDRHVGLAHARLSIIDLSAIADQPMEDISGNAVITYNGEIYNFRELQNELLEKGFTFRTHSDTEVILNGYLCWGIEGMLERLDGMFAFVLLDKKNNLAFACRDRFGKKPLYYFHSSEKFSFSSNIGSIWNAEKKSLTLDYESLDYYLSELSVPQPKTIWKQVSQVRPACFLRVDSSSGELVEKKYWTLKAQDQIRPVPMQEAQEEVEKMIVRSILKRTVSDVPIACFLSGGVDSGLIVSLLASNSTEKVKTFSLGFDYDHFNELPLARKVAEKYQTDHTEIKLHSEVTEILPELIESYAEPFADSSSIPVYYITKAIRSNVKVALSGDGGDEVFGGYHEYSWAYLTDQFLRDHPGETSRKIASVSSKITHALKMSEENKGLYYDYASQPGAFKLFRQMGFDEIQKQKLYGSDFPVGARRFTLLHLNSIWSSHDQGNNTSALFRSSFDTRLLNDYLVKIDRSSMKNSLEVRCPFLDEELVEYVFSLDNELKLKDGTPKYLLKKIASDYLGKEVVERKKSGFGIPIGEWIRKEMKEFVSDLILSERFNQRKLFDPVYVKQIFEEHINRKHDHRHRIWALVCLEIWFRKFLDI